MPSCHEEPQLLRQTKPQRTGCDEALLARADVHTAGRTEPAAARVARSSVDLQILDAVRRAQEALTVLERALRRALGPEVDVGIVIRPPEAERMKGVTEARRGVVRDELPGVGTFERIRFAQKAMIITVTACAVFATAARAADAPSDLVGPKAITVDAEAQARFGLGIAILKSVGAPNGVATSARVLDPAPLVQMDGQLAAAAAAFAASRAEALRIRKLFEVDRTASKREVEVATAHEQADVQRLNAARRQLALEWGSGLADLPAHRRAELLDDLTHGRAELVRVEIPTGVPAPAVKSSIGIRGSTDTEVVSGSVLGSLPTVDPRQQRAVLVEIKGNAATLPVGQMLSAEVPASANVAGGTGVLLPRSALLRSDSHVWVYVQTAATTFQRREVRDYQPLNDGWFVSSGLAPGQRVVATGAATLLGIESPTPAAADSK